MRNYTDAQKKTYTENIDNVVAQLVDTSDAQKAAFETARKKLFDITQEIEATTPEDIKEQNTRLKEAEKEFRIVKLNSKSILEKEVIKELMLLNVETKEANDQQNKDVFAATKHYYESSGKDNATTNTKLALSNLFKYTNNKDNSPVLERDPNTGLPIIADFGEVWSTLESELANIVQYAKQGKEGVEYVFPGEQMLKKITELSQKDATYKQVLGVFKKLNKNQQIQLLQAFSKSTNNFIQGQKQKHSKFIAQDTDGPITEDSIFWRFFNPSRNSKKWRTFQKWAENLKDTALYNENISEENRIKKAQQILSNWDSAFLKADAFLSKKEDPFITKKIATEISESLEELGININPNSILNYLNPSNDIQINKNRLNQIGRLFTAENVAYSPKKIAEGNGSFNYEDKNPINGEKKIILELASEASLFDKNYGENTIIGATGSSYWDYGLNHYFKKKINQFKNNAKFYVNELKTSLFHNDSLLLDYLAKEDAEIESRIFSGFKIQGARQGYDYKDLDPAEERSLRINLALSDVKVLTPMTPADKGSWNLISGFDPITIGDLKEGFSYNSETESYIIPDQVKQFFSNYAITELKRMRQTHIALFGENALPNEKLIQHYHYRKLDKDGNPDRKTGNGLKSQIFTSFNDKELLKEMGIVQPDGTIVPTNNLIGNDVFNRIIDNAINNLIKKEIKGALDSETISLSKDNNLLDIDIDSEFLKKLIKTMPEKDKDGVDINYAKRKDTALRMVMAKYALSGTVGNIETLKVFSGDPAFYKTMPDLSKRIPGIIAPGKDLILSSADEVFYRAAVLQDVENTKGDALKNEYAENLKAEKDKDGKRVFSDEDIEIILSPYEDYSVTDAQGWITLDRWRFLNEKLGKFDAQDKDLVAAFNRLKEGKGTAEDIKLVVTMPMKGMHFELRQEGNLQVPTYIKYSQAVLIPQFTKGRELNSLLEAMTDPENNIDEVIVDSGVKTGALSPINITGTTAGSILPSGEIKFNVMNLRNEYWKLQQDLTPHEDGGAQLEGSQVKKNMLANIFQDELYGDISGHELIRQMHSVDSQLSNIGRQELERDFWSKS